MAIVKQGSAIASRQIEMANRHEIISRALSYGYNAFLPVVDDGIDFILHREDDDRFIKVQLKARWTIERKYCDKGIWMAFPIGKGSSRIWHLMPHDLMVEKAVKYTASNSWINHHAYSTNAPGAELRKLMAPYRLELILKNPEPVTDPENSLLQTAA